MKLQTIAVITLFFVALIMGSVFQSCGQGAFSVGSGSGTIPFDHPDPDPHPKLNSSSPVLLMNRQQVFSVLREAFLVGVSDANEARAFFQIFNTEILPQQHMYGGPCDIWDSPYDCNGNLANLESPMAKSSSTLRESSRIQMCRRLTARDNLMQALVNRVKGDDMSPNRDSLGRVVQLFYPTLDGTDKIIDLLIGMDRKMANESETLLDRWRLAVLTVCETPYWEIL